ncbi:hypothetical protein AAH174_13955, partial [Bacteroides thetaiotaomicron]|uniref:hypothetical protein n=1 Tax=Bacteroides thetaiotaomicron TaxID=818 RepID=UPI0039B3E07E
GSIQVICDVLKMLTKEIFTPKDADRYALYKDGPSLRHNGEQQLMYPVCYYTKVEHIYFNY